MQKIITYNLTNDGKIVLSGTTRFAYFLDFI